LIVYEYPFNERIRTLLRLEDLYEKFTFFIQQSDFQHHHIAIATIFEMLEVAGRADLKSDLLQELDRQKNTLLSFKSNPNVQADMLDQVINDVELASSHLMATTGKTGQHIRENEWLMSIRGRTIIPGGACEFDLPSYHAWKRNSPEKRYADISEWFAPIAPLFDAIAVVLRLLRESGSTTKVIAESGSYQQMLQGKMYQLLRVTLAQELGAIPEISANKYMLWIRIVSQDGNLKPKAYDGDVPFDLTLCNF
jgi:cell division protein ZapD